MEHFHFVAGESLSLELDSRGRWRNITADGQTIPMAADRAAFGICQVLPAASAAEDPGAKITDAIDVPFRRGVPDLWAGDRRTPWRAFEPITQGPGSGSIAFEAEGFRLDTRWTSLAGAIRIDGRLHASGGDERACLLRMVLPWTHEPGLRWWNRIGDACEIEPATEYRQTFVPIAAACDGRAGAALAVPPDAPCYFAAGYAGDVGLSMMLRLGLSPETRPHPSQADFSLLLLPADATWGFRDALRRYYELFPEYYRRRTEKYGLWFMGPSEHYPDPDALMFCEVGEDFDCVETHDGFVDIARHNAARGLLTFPYTIVGTCHVIRRPKLPEDPAEAVGLLHDPPPEFTCWHGECLAQAGYHDPDDMLGAVLAAGVHDPDRRLYVVPRDIPPYLDKTISVVCNPSPHLGPHCQGRRWLAYARKIAEMDDVAGVYVDSLGRWCDYFDYRREQFRHSRLGLSFLEDGRLGWPAKFTHYEFLTELRGLLHHRGRLLFGNGVHQGTRGDGRFFLAALLDVAGSESGPATSLWKYDLRRTMMGAKPYLLFSQGQWAAREQVERYFKQSTLFGIVPSFFPRYYLREDQIDLDQTYAACDPDESDLPAGAFYRDRDLHERYLPVIRRLHAAGWQPVTRATVSAPALRIERFGQPPGEVVWAVLNPTAEAVSFEMHVEARALGLDAQPRLERIVCAADVASDTPSYVLPPGEVEVLTLGG